MVTAPLAAGAYGDAVARLQTFLIQQGHALPASELNRKFFGAATRTALQKFQQSRGLSPSGYVDTYTAPLLGPPAAASAPTLTPATPGAPTSPVQQIPPTAPPTATISTTVTQPTHPATAAARLNATEIILQPAATGDAVASLHDALDTIGLPLDSAEQESMRYGTGTTAAVRKLQSMIGLKPTGILDAPTYAAVAAVMGRLGPTPGQSPTAVVDHRVVDGYVSDMNGEPLTGAVVVAFNVQLRSSQEIGRATTDERGTYRIAYSTGTPGANREVADLQIHVLGPNNEVLFTSDTVFNAPVQTTIHLPLGGPLHEQPSEFSWLHGTLAPILGTIPPSEIDETEHRDLSFLAGRTGIVKARIALWAVAARLAEQTQLPHELFYALFRRNVPADVKTTALASSTQGIDLAANAQRLQDALLAISPAMLESAINSALGANLMPASYAARVKDDLAKLAALAAQSALDSVHGMGKTSVASVLGTLAVDADTQRRFIQLYAQAAGAQKRTFWKDLAKNPAFTAAQVAEMRFGVVIGRLTRGHLPLITALAAMRRAGTIKGARDLARLTAADWTALLQKKQTAGRPIGIPANITAQTPALAVETYATMLERNFTLVYPTPAFSARVAADLKTPFPNRQAVAAFLDSNPSFDLHLTNIDTFAKTVNIAAPVRATLYVAQRLAKICPSYAAMSTLFADGIHTAQQVYAMGHDRFISTYGANASIGATAAARMYGAAEQTYGMALALTSRLNLSFNKTSPAAIGGPDPKQVADQIKDAPNLQTLFGSDSFCACLDCQSVLGAAAYLVDLLEFLKKRDAGGGLSVRDVLLARRPDIAQLELSCPNTNTALPYIDLVNELLEDAIAPPADPAKAARTRQTTLTTPELNANPQYVNPDAYTTLAAAKAVYPWTLPFDLLLAEARAYLGQLGLDRVKLRRTFLKPLTYPSLQARSNAVETLGLSAVEADIITGGPSAAANQSWSYWGLTQTGNTFVDPYDPSKTVSGTWIDVLSQVRVLLSRASLSYQELARLLNTRFINNDGTLQITAVPPDSCDVATMTLSGLDQDVLDRLHRFVRLWRRLACNVYDLDDAIWVLQNAATDGLPRLNDLLLRQLAVVQTLQSAYMLPTRQAITFFLTSSTFATLPTRDIPTLPGDSVQNSLYHDLFENLTVLSPPDAIFALNPDGTEIAAIASKPLLADHGAALLAAFEISSTDLGLLITTFTDGNLTLANLASIYRVVQLAGLLGTTLPETITLLAIAEAPLDTTPFFERINPFDGTRPEAMLAFIDATTALRAIGSSVQQIDYILRGVFDDSSGVAPNPITVGTLLLTLRNCLVKINAETAFSPDPTGAGVRKELAKLLSPADLDGLMAILAGTSPISPAAANTFIATALGPYMDAAAAQANLVGGGALPAGQPRYEYVLQQLLSYDQRTRGTGLVIQTLAQSLSVATAAAVVLIEAWFPSLSIPGKFLIEDFLALPGLALADTATPISPADPAFAPYFGVYASLTRTALLVTSLKLASADVSWWRDTGVGQGWIDPTQLPAAPVATAQGRFNSWMRLVTACNVRDRIPVPNRSFATVFGMAGGATTKAQYLTQLAAVTQWSADSLQVFCGDPTSVADQGALSLAYPADFVSERALARLLPCFQTLRRTGIPADVSSWIGDTVTPDAAHAIKQSVKSHYGTDQWLALAKQLRDGLRHKQRDALVSYLLANPPSDAKRWLTPDDVFARYLIDVEMCACQATSRIVQATLTIQLFVQRCLLNLEAAVTVDPADGDWLQWKWMNRYRVWQANREVFLFPENLLHSNLRADKSPFFRDLEQELKQGDFTDDLAETALENYLEKLERVARLDVCGTFHDLESGQDVLHVVARTQASPPLYYIRRWIDSSRWTAWEKIDLDINSDHVLPLSWNGRLYLFWAIVSVMPDQTQPTATAADLQTNPPSPPNVHLQVVLAWSQYKQGKWQAKQTAPQPLTFQGVTDPAAVTLKSALLGPLLQIDLYLDSGDFTRDHCGAFLLGGAGNGIEAFILDTSGLGDVGPIASEIGQFDASQVKPSIDPPTDEQFDGDWLAPTPWSEDFFSAERPRVGPLQTTYDLYGTQTPELVLQRADYFRLVAPHQIARFDSSLPFFYRDSARQYFCVPTIYYQNGRYFTINAPPYVYHPFYRAEYRFWPFYHAFVPLFITQLNFGGVDALFARKLQLDPAAVAGQPEFDFGAWYQPTDCVLTLPDGSYPGEGVDFEPDAGYSIYNWELLFHTPFFIAESLSSNQRFEEAKKWFEYIFSPQSAGTDPIPKRYWITKPFFQEGPADYTAQQLDALMKAINTHDPGLEHQVAVWRNDPFDPDTIAQLRPVAYQRAVVMRYIDNLVRWGDQLFSQNTLESINQATQLYVLAGALLGPRPEIVAPRVQPDVKTYADLEGSLDVFSNELVAAENAIPPVRVNVPTNGAQKLPALYTLYFRIPPNQQLLTYWDTVADRLFKIRHCMNIQGVVQQLPLFAPPIDPALLVAAVAAGLDLGSVLSDINAALPPYRFAIMIREAATMCTAVRALGEELLAALEKSDAEALAQIRSSSEKLVQNAVADVRTRQIDAAGQQLTVLAKAKQTFSDRAAFFNNRDLMNGWEIAAQTATAASLIPLGISIALDTTATAAHPVPKAQVGGSGVGGSPHASAQFGGENVGHSASAGAKAARITAAVLQTGSQMRTVLGDYHNRQDQWNLEGTLPNDEIARIDAETLAATILQDVATKEKAAQDLAVTNANDVDDFLHTKFTNQDLYDWMVSETSTTYFQAYQLAFSIARQAERCFRRELAIPVSNPNFIQFGYWDSLRKGLTAGDKLHYDLQRLEAAYYTQNARELEITKNVSLLQIDPYALLELRNNGTCLVNLPELLFDLDNPGHYLRRLKSVAITVPCVVGPYTGVSVTLNLLNNQTRTSTDTGSGYPRLTNTTDVRFLDDPGGTSEIVTSDAQNDSGLFELRFEDERYLPFEGAGAISSWRITLNSVLPQFNYSTISDVVLHLRFTAGDGGAAFASTVVASVKSQLNKILLAESRRGLYRLWSARHDYGTNWTAFLRPAMGTDQVLTIETPPERFPFFTRGMDIKAVGLDVLSNTADPGDYTLVVTPPGGTPQTVTLSADPTLNGVHHWNNSSLKVDLGRAPLPKGTALPAWSFKLKKADATDFQSLTAADLDDLILIVSYQVS